ncbi:hypothetical protein C0580_01880 [Candidatus Parcubacteria bacterium]|nr:MAG: hypothetical protein C0580_01880 [Candidatus Parcubacteria bacterium]
MPLLRGALLVVDDEPHVRPLLERDELLLCGGAAAELVEDQVSLAWVSEIESSFDLVLGGKFET